jgi:hypothetical protein
MRLYKTKKYDKNKREKEEEIEFDLIECTYSKLLLNKLWKKKRKEEAQLILDQIKCVGLDWVVSLVTLPSLVGLSWAGRDLSSSSRFVFAFFFFIIIMYYHWLFHNDANAWCGPGFLHREKDSNIFQSITFWIVKYIYLLYCEILSHHLENSLLCRRRNTIYFLKIIFKLQVNKYFLLIG